MSTHKPPHQAAPSRVRRWYYTVAYPVIAGAIVIALCLLLAVSLLFDQEDDRLPIEFRILEPTLSNLPVTLSKLRSCSCWGGPRNQAERKYKFTVSNQTDALLNIGGGEQSALRLILAYPSKHLPSPLTLPRSTSHDVQRQFASPAGRWVNVTSVYRTVRPSAVTGANRTFAVPPTYTLWAIPPNPHALTEIKDGEAGGTFPTIVDKTILLPGEAYSDERLGRGSWTFYIPLRPSFAAAFAGDFTPLIRQEDHEEQVIFVGIGAFKTVGQQAVSMIGFAPAPSDAALEDPSAL